MFDDAKWSARRRVFAFFAVFLAIPMLLDVFGEADVLSHAVDETGLAAVSIAILIYLALSARRNSTKEIAVQRLVILALVVAAIAFQVYGLFVEFGTEDFGDDIPVLIGLVLMLINGLV